MLIIYQKTLSVNCSLEPCVNEKDQTEGLGHSNGWKQNNIYIYIYDIYDCVVIYVIYITISIYITIYNNIYITIYIRSKRSEMHSDNLL